MIGAKAHHGCFSFVPLCLRVRPPLRRGHCTKPFLEVCGSVFPASAVHVHSSYAHRIIRTSLIRPQSFTGRLHGRSCGDHCVLGNSPLFPFPPHRIAPRCSITAWPESLSIGRIVVACHRSAPQKVGARRHRPSHHHIQASPKNSVWTRSCR